MEKELQRLVTVLQVLITLALGLLDQHTTGTMEMPSVLGMTHVWDYYGGNYDIQYDKPSQSESYRGQITTLDGATVLAVKNQVLKSSLPVTTASCMYGQITGFACGAVVANPLAGFWDDNNVYHTNRIQVDPGVWVSAYGRPGDSGGPAFYGDGPWTVYGISAHGTLTHVSSFCSPPRNPCTPYNADDVDWIFMPVDYINAKGIYLYFENP